MPENTKNKIKYGIKNVYFAAITGKDAQTGAVTYGTPVAEPGAVSISLSPEGSNDPFYADDVVYYRTSSNNGYTGSIEFAKISEAFRETILQETKDNNSVFIENANNAEPVHFALLFEFTGDAHKIRHVLYDCTATRPNIESQTKEAAASPVTESFDLTVDPREDGLVKARTGADTPAAAYNGWFTAVYEPVTTP